MTTPAHPSTMTPREALADALHAALLDAVLTVDGGELDGTEVVKVSEIGRVFQRSNWPELNVHGADARTPARVVVTAECPNCHETAAILVNLSAQLTVTDAGSALKVAASTKATSHLCGQTSAELEDGQVTIADLLGSATADETDEDTAPPSADECEHAATEHGVDGCLVEGCDCRTPYYGHPAALPDDDLDDGAG